MTGGGERATPYEKLIERIGDRKVVIDESVYFWHLEDRLNSAGIQWRRFPKRTLDKEISKGMVEGELLLTRDYEFFLREQHRALLLPINAGHMKRKTKQNEAWKREIEGMDKSGLLTLKLRWGMVHIFGVTCTVCFETYHSYGKFNSHIWKESNGIST